MATYRAIAATETDPNSPVTATLMTALAENPVAIIEGATGAPRILGEAAASNDEVDVITVVAANTRTTTGVGFDVVEGDLSTTSSTYVLARQFTVVSYTGAMRFRATHRASSGASNLRVRKNGSTVQSWSTTSSGGSVRSVDISIVPGDVIRWEHFRTSETSIVSDIEIRADDVYQEVSLLARASNL